MSKSRKVRLEKLIGCIILAICSYQLVGDRALAQNYLPQQQATLPPQQGILPQQQAAPSAPMCVYPNGASCPMATEVLPGTSCTCQQVWPGVGQVAGGLSAQSGQAGAVPSSNYRSQGAPTATQPSLLTPPPPAGMVPIQ